MANNNEVLLFSLKETHRLAERMANVFGTELAPIREERSPDGEVRMRSEIPVRGQDVFVLAGLHQEADDSLHDKLFRLFLFLHSLNEASARRIILLLPYLPYARQDCQDLPRQSIGLKALAMLLESVKIDGVLSVDVHNLSSYQNAFRCSADYLEAAPLFAEEILRKVGDKDWVVVSADAASLKRARRFRDELTEHSTHPISLALLDKTRSKGGVETSGLLGQVKGRPVVIYESVIATGNSVHEAATFCKKAGASEIFVCATHPVFAKGCEERLSSKLISRIFVSDSVKTKEEFPPSLQERIETVSLSLMLAEAVRRMHAGQGLSVASPSSMGHSLDAIL